MLKDFNLPVRFFGVFYTSQGGKEEWQREIMAVGEQSQIN